MERAGIGETQRHKEQLQREVGVAPDVNGIIEKQRDPGYRDDDECGVKQRQRVLGERL